MANKLIVYRITRLEETVKERNSAIDRVYMLERHNAVVQEQIKELSHRVDLIENRKEWKSR